MSRVFYLSNVMHYIYYIHGLVPMYLNIDHIPKGVVFEQFSNPDVNERLTDIVYTCWNKKLGHVKYIRKIKQTILRRLNDPSTQSVKLFGHSYGGAICSEVALELQKHPHIHKLTIRTYGSIYIIPHVPRMTQYMFKNDIALQCDALEDKYVKWLKEPSTNPVVSHIKYPIERDIIKEMKRCVHNVPGSVKDYPRVLPPRGIWGWIRSHF
jgi:hypothetical protein